MNLASIVEPHPPGSLALVEGERRVSYGELRDQVAAGRALLASAGVGTKERVALVATASIEFVAWYLAVLGTGAVAVPLNPESPPAELERELACVRPAAIVAGPTDAIAARAVGSLGYRVLDGVGLLGEAAESPSGVPGVVERREHDPAVLLFTSGTAGPPRPAVLTHGSLLANIEQMELRVASAATSDDVALLVIPLFHIFGLNAVLGVQLFVGGATVLAGRFGPDSALALVGRESVTILPGAPAVFSALVEHPGATGRELASVRLAVSAAAPLPIDVAERFEARFGKRLYQGYGLTEASPAVTFPDVEAPYDPTSVGHPLPGVELQVVDLDGAEVDDGDPGEILVRGPNVFAGYFEDELATAAVLDSSGWLHTGDIAVVGEHGQISIVDRSTDLVIVSGFNVFPAEVEGVLARHRDVVEAAVVGVPDAAQGESVRAFVVVREARWPEGSPAPPEGLDSELRGYCAEHLARYKCPSRITFVRALPRSTHGKALRRELV